MPESAIDLHSFGSQKGQNPHQEKGHKQPQKEHKGGIFGQVNMKSVDTLSCVCTQVNTRALALTS